MAQHKQFIIIPLKHYQRFHQSLSCSSLNCASVVNVNKIVSPFLMFINPLSFSITTCPISFPSNDTPKSKSYIYLILLNSHSSLSISQTANPPPL